MGYRPRGGGRARPACEGQESAGVCGALVRAEEVGEEDAAGVDGLPGGVELVVFDIRILNQATVESEIFESRRSEQQAGFFKCLPDGGHLQAVAVLVGIMVASGEDLR